MGQVIQFPRKDHGLVLTKKQLAAYLRCSTKSVERRVSEGMPSFMVGGLRRFRLSDVEAWLEGKNDGGTDTAA